MIAFDGLAQSLWPNGAGRKADILAGDGWAIGFAWLERDAPFSDFTGVDRTIMLVEGPGFSLHPLGLRDYAIHERHVPHDFDGGWQTRCSVIGPCLVLNVFTRTVDWRHEVTVMDTPTRIEPGCDTAVVVVVLQGTVSIAGQTAGPCDAFDLISPTELTAASGSRIALYRITRVP